MLLISVDFQVLPLGFLLSSLLLGHSDSFGASSVPPNGCEHSSLKIWFG